MHLEVDLERRAHGGLDVQDLHVLPVLLEERHQEVDSKLDVEDDLVLGHLDVSNGEGHAHDLLHLELDGSLGGIDLLLQVVVLVEHGRELARLGQTRSEDTGDLLDEGGRCQEIIVLLGELLDELFVLVELLEVIDSHLVDTELIGLLAVLLVSENAALGLRSGDGGEAEGAGETLVSGRIVVLQGDLKLDGLGELSHLALLLLLLNGDCLTLRVLEEVLHRCIQQFAVNLTHFFLLADWDSFFFFKLNVKKIS